MSLSGPKFSDVSGSAPADKQNTKNSEQKLQIDTEVINLSRRVNRTPSPDLTDLDEEYNNQK